MIRFASTAIVSFSTKPLIVGIWLGILTSFLAFLELVYIIYHAILGDVVPGWASTLGITAFLFGILFIILGVIGTYIASIHSALQGRPKFVIEEKTSHSIGTQANIAEASTAQEK
jgi:dolichol-phosphate mannosyltransferase